MLIPFCDIIISVTKIHHKNDLKKKKTGSGWRGIHSADQADLELTEIPLWMLPQHQD